VEDTAAFLRLLSHEHAHTSTKQQASHLLLMLLLLLMLAACPHVPEAAADGFLGYIYKVRLN